MLKSSTTALLTVCLINLHSQDNFPIKKKNKQTIQTNSKTIDNHEHLQTRVPQQQSHQNNHQTTPI